MWIVRRGWAWRQSWIARVLGAFIGTFFVFQGVIGIPQIPEQVQAWSPIVRAAGELLAATANPFSGEFGRWVALIIGLALIAWFAWPSRTRPSAVAPQSGMTYDGQIAFGGQIARKAAPQPPPPGPREYVPADITPSSLQTIFAGRTALQAKALALPYIGRWMRVSGQLRDVHANDRLIVTLADSPGVTWLYFDASTWGARFSSLAPGTMIDVTGKLDRVDPGGLSLVECELAKATAVAEDLTE